MTKYYVQVLILASFLFFCSITKKFGKEKLSKYDSISLSENFPVNSTKNQEKKEIGSSQKRQLVESDKKPIRIFVDLTDIKKKITTNEYKYLNYLNISVIESAVDEVKETLEKLVNNSPNK